jgi:putative restriction endonuclease
LDQDPVVRLATFAWLKEQAALFGDVLPIGPLRQGFIFQGERVHLLGQQGIFKPRVLRDIPLSITTTPNSPYDDNFDRDGLLRYRYRGTDPTHRDNVGLRLAMQRQVPLVYFHGVLPGQYLAVWPVFIVGDDTAGLTFTVAADDADYAIEALRRPGAEAELVGEAASRREYITARVKVRLYQRGFRERVLRAYRESCALCHLKHRELLDAAHIVEDGRLEGEPIVTNGLALCKIHHAAFDHCLIGVRPDYVIEVHPRILEESDGPMLRHGLQGLHQTRIELPHARKDHPDPERLRDRYERFKGAA